MNTLQATISKVNFSEMKFIEKSNGIKVMQLPFILNFKNKSQLLNNKKQSLLAKYLQFASLTKKKNIIFSKLFQKFNIRKSKTS